ncbi:MAG: sugar transferase [Lachnospiraceae bacterium]|uniref:Exopolysaccharide biosynthesis polyprenyl glycosylphosphotransferase n=1 Tax=Candidatus Weimeria bifida TaxID=2599074 RepID=A0A6N7IZX3_9FIRM|nr:exopolysaccharide biosynthesis polyprenyl glycosylphosphotransferase [Candidatus Weimeria bifida]RRF96443.1 MAG: sugar transferase [Lachnospiraceae bacterium]
MSEKLENGKHLYRFLTNLIITVAVALLFAYGWNHWLNILLDRPFRHLGCLAMILIYTFLAVFFIYSFGGYEIGISRISHASIGCTLASFIVNIIMAVMTVMMVGYRKLVPTIIFVYFELCIIEVIVLFIITYLGTWLFRKIFPPYRMLQIHGMHVNNLDRKMEQRSDKFVIAETVMVNAPLSEIEKKIDEYDTVLINDIPSELKNKILKYCFDRQKRVYFTPKISDIIVRESDELNLFDSPLYLSRNVGFSMWQRIVKRAGDIILSLIGIILTSPIMLVTAILIHSYDKGPVFYRQERYTIHKKKFKVIKFRSMIVDAEKFSGARLASEHDDRITPIGHFIRSTRIDEIPQFFNVLKGDMSFVGPRPERPEIHEEYCEKVPEFDFRLAVKAGLTGYAQVFGKYNTTTYDKLKFDMIYVQKASILLDMKLILLTLRVVFQKESTEGVEEGEKTAK